jgi:hypothetical protein
MAAGSSSPEVIAALVGVFFSDTNSVGTGTVVGSTVFNQLFIIGGAIIVSPNKCFHLDWRALTRDLVFYCASLTMLAVFFDDAQITCVESWCLFLTYCAYILVNAYYERIVGVLCPWDKTGKSTGFDLEAHIEAEKLKKQMRESGHTTNNPMSAIAPQPGGSFNKALDNAGVVGSYSEADAASGGGEGRGVTTQPGVVALDGGAFGTDGGTSGSFVGEEGSFVGAGGGGGDLDLENGGSTSTPGANSALDKHQGGNILKKKTKGVHGGLLKDDGNAQTGSALDDEHDEDEHDEDEHDCCSSLMHYLKKPLELMIVATVIDR